MQNTTYSLAEVPALNQGDSSRFALPKTAAGWNSSPAASTALAYSTLIQERIAETPEIEPPTVSVALRRVVMSTQGNYILVDAGTITAEPSKHPNRQTRFAKCALTGGRLIDALLAGDETVQVREETIWNALLALCEELRPHGESLRKICDAAQNLVLLRAGVVR